MARRALVIHRQAPGIREDRLGRILTFFGVPWQAVTLTDHEPTPSGTPDEAYAVLGSAETVAAAWSMRRTAAFLERAEALYTYAADDQRATARAISVFTDGQWTARSAPRGLATVRIAADCHDLAGPMSGVEAAIQPSAADGIFVPGEAEVAAEPLMSLDGAASFLHIRARGVPTYFCASAAMVDIDEPVGRNYYDIKEHFLSAVPLVMFLTSVFREVMWRPRELGACLIIDDPLLKGRYGFCDFPRLRDLMREHWFTTNIAFIPWNWRRTTRRASEFFRRESDLFSVSVHGCDHVAAEFGATSLDLIDSRARLAQTRMRKHQARTRIKHDPIMVFPQGVFSANCPAVLKRNGFVAAVNTEVSPVGDDDPKTVIADVWDTAILRYGSFPIYTRRYPHHGLENFAFDLLLGKPCFIVAHHESFRDGGAALVRLVDRLRALDCTLHWRSPREVIRRAYRSRTDDGRVSVQMYGTEVLLANPRDEAGEFDVYKPEGEPNLVASVTLNGHDSKWGHTSDELHFRCSLPPRAETLVKVRYRANAVDQPAPVSMRYELTVAARRILSEFRDEYIHKLARPA